MHIIAAQSSEELQHLLDRKHVPRQEWGVKGSSKPFERFVQSVQKGELLLFLQGSRIICRSTKVCSRIFKPDYSAMLFETRRFKNGHAKKAKTKSNTEKLLIRDGESYQVGFSRMCLEELQIMITDPDLHFLTYRGFKPGSLGESDSYPGLLSIVDKHHVDWRMPRIHVRPSYHEDCGYCVNTSAWDKIPRQIARELKLARAA